MSYLMRPRAHFKGVFTANVPTANNDKVSMALDEPNVQPWNPQNLTDAAFRAWMMQTRDITPPGGTSTTWLNSYFNYFGDCAMTFNSRDGSGTTTRSAMTSGIVPDGTIYQPGQDPFLSGYVELLGHPFFDKRSNALMVDLDPVGIYGTQIFSGQFRVVAGGGATPAVLLSGENPTRACLYDLYFDRNINPSELGPQMGAGVWQMAIATKDLTFGADVSNSPTLSALQAAAQAGLGLVVRYVTYFTLSGISEEELGNKFKESNYAANAASGRIVGTIGAWSSDDPLLSAPTGRVFLGTNRLARPVGARAFLPAGRDKVPTIAATAAPAAAAAVPTYVLGPIVAWVDTAHGNVVLDCGTTIPEDTGVRTPPAPGDLHKTDYGTLTLTITSGGQEQTVNQIPYAQYNRAAYELAGGIIEVPYSAAMAGALADPNGILKLYGTVNGTNQLLIDEIAFATIGTDDRCLYLQVNETVSYRVRPLWKGRPMPGQSVALTLSQYTYTAADVPNQLVNKQLVPLTAAEDYVVSLPANGTYVTDAQGCVTFSVRGLKPGAVMIRYQPSGDTFDPNPPGCLPPYGYFGFVSYNAFRVLPDDNFDAVPDAQITWDFVYQNVIRYFYLIYPAMFLHLPFQNEATAQQNAAMISQMVAKDSWNTTTYMPVSRDLSDGKRKLLQRWCALNE